MEGRASLTGPCQSQGGRLGSGISSQRQFDAKERADALAARTATFRVRGRRGDQSFDPFRPWPGSRSLYSSHRGRGRTSSFLGSKMGSAAVEGQAALVEGRLSHLKSTIRRNHRHPIAIADAIREQADALSSALSFVDLRKLESIAGRYYWQVWARVPIHFASSWRNGMPEHWHTAGPRTSRVDRQWPRRAMTTGPGGDPNARALRVRAPFSPRRLAAP